MSDDIAIKVNNLTKIYRLYNSPLDRLKESLHPFGKKYHHDFYALNDVNLQIKRGETVGIIGKNGSGKSTLLKIITGILTPNSGTVEVNGKVSALLELGAGFNPELTGIENVYFNGTLSGQTKAEIDAKLESILTFADIGHYVNQPVKCYSSGMFVRLAFAVASSIEPKILIIDEAFSVGDIFFQQKCYRRLDELREKEVTILLVSHSMHDIVQYCDHTLLLDHGNAVFCGNSDEAVKRYFLLEQGGGSSDENSNNTFVIDHSDSKFMMCDSFWPESAAFLNLSKSSVVSTGLANCTALAICDEAGQPSNVFRQGDTASFFYEFELHTAIQVPIGGLVIRNDRDVLVHGKSTLEYGSEVPKNIRSGERIRFRQEICLNIAPGSYTFNIGLSKISEADYLMSAFMDYPTLNAKTERLCHLIDAGSFAIYGPPSGTAVRFLHHGVCDLPGRCEVAVKKEKQDASRIVVVEYPKSGGSWLVSILAHALGLPRRDIYVNGSDRFVDVAKHPWYADVDLYDITDACVMKSHEPPNSKLHNFNAKFIHLVRDGRDVVVSKYFFEKDFCLQNNLIDSFEYSFEDFLKITATEWSDFVKMYDENEFITVKYEELLSDTVATVSNLLLKIGYSLPQNKIEDAVKACNKENMRKELEGAYKYNTFVRKGISGDWQNHFNHDNKLMFCSIAKETLIALGYETDSSWCESE